jgi:hypothetical protein
MARVSATPLSKGHNKASGTMKTKEHSKQVRDKVVEKYRSLLKDGKNMTPQQTCQERAAHQNAQTRQGGH